MSDLHDKRFPGESPAYRAARDELLEAEAALRRQVAEVALRRQVAEVAGLRAGLPTGGAVAEDYAFAEGAPDLDDDDTMRETRLSELFAPGLDTLVIYGFMYAPGAEPCPMCTAFLDSLDGNAPHLAQRANLAVVAKAPLRDIRAWARARSWRNLRLLSSGANTFNADYFAEAPDGSQLPILHVFRRLPSGAIHHAYTPELFFVPPEPGQHPRHLDMLWPLWNLLDLTPEGRGEDWYPATSYE